MNHPADPQLWSLAAGDDAVAAEVSTHVDACESCRARVEQLRRVRVVARQGRAPEPSPASRVAALAAFEDALAREQARRAWWWERRSLVLPALGLAAAAGAGLALMVLEQEEATPSPSLAAVLVPEDAVQPRRELPARARVELGTPDSMSQAPAQPMTEARRRPTDRAHGESTVARARPAAPLEAADVAATPLPPPASAPEFADILPGRTQVDVEFQPRFPRVEDARRAIAVDPAQALSDALLLMSSEVPGEAAAAMDVVRQAVLAGPSSEMVERALAGAGPDGNEDLEFLACEASVIGRRAAEAVAHCRAFVARHAGSPRARDAAFVAGTVARDQLGDCRGAVADYSAALVFNGQLGSLNDEALFWRAWCRAELGERALARADLEHFLARYPMRRVDPQVRQLERRLSPR